MSASNYTKADEIAAEIEARMALILAADGFSCDAGDVFQGRLDIDDEMVPCTSVIEGVDDVQTGPSQKVVTAHIVQQYAIVRYVPCDPAKPNEAARRAIADVKKAIFLTAGKPDSTWGGKVRAVRYRGRNIGPRADGKPLVMAVVEIAVEYAENLADA